MKATSAFLFLLVFWKGELKTKQRGCGVRIFCFFLAHPNAHFYLSLQVVDLVDTVKKLEVLMGVIQPSYLKVK